MQRQRKDKSPMAPIIAGLDEVLKKAEKNGNFKDVLEGAGVQKVLIQLRSAAKSSMSEEEQASYQELLRFIKNQSAKNKEHWKDVSASKLFAEAPSESRAQQIQRQDQKQEQNMDTDMKEWERLIIQGVRYEDRLKKTIFDVLKDVGTLPQIKDKVQEIEDRIKDGKLDSDSEVLDFVKKDQVTPIEEDLERRLARLTALEKHIEKQKPGPITDIFRKWFDSKNYEKYKESTKGLLSKIQTAKGQIESLQEKCRQQYQPKTM